MADTRRADAVAAIALSMRDTSTREILAALGRAYDAGYSNCEKVFDRSDSNLTEETPHG